MGQLIEIKPSAYGFGAFAGEDIKKDQFVVGMLLLPLARVSSGEADACGAEYLGEVLADTVWEYEARECVPLPSSLPIPSLPCSHPYNDMR